MAEEHCAKMQKQRPKVALDREAVEGTPGLSPDTILLSDSSRLVMGVTD